MLDAWWVLFSTCVAKHSSNDHGDQNSFDGALSKGIKGFSTSGRFACHAAFGWRETLDCLAFSQVLFLRMVIHGEDIGDLSFPNGPYGELDHELVEGLTSRGYD